MCGVMGSRGSAAVKLCGVQRSAVQCMAWHAGSARERWLDVAGWCIGWSGGQPVAGHRTRGGCPEPRLRVQANALIAHPKFACPASSNRKYTMCGRTGGAGAAAADCTVTTEARNTANASMFAAILKPRNAFSAREERVRLKAAATARTRERENSQASRPPNRRLFQALAANVVGLGEFVQQSRPTSTTTIAILGFSRGLMSSHSGHGCMPHGTCHLDSIGQKIVRVSGFTKNTFQLLSHTM